MKTKLEFLFLTSVCFLIVSLPLQSALAQGSGAVVSVAPAQNAVTEGDTLTVNVTISNVQNLYGLDVTVTWNNSALEIISATHRLGVESNPSGVLHETATYPIQIPTNEISQQAGQYKLVATSAGNAASFNGSGTIATLTFNVTGTGQTAIDILSELADHPEPGETNSELIQQNDVGATVNATPIPEFPQIAALGLLIVGVTIALISSKKLKRRTK